MRKMQVGVSSTEKIIELFCNSCGREIEKDEFGYFEDVLHIEKQWGYFSHKDTKTHSFDICESCYDRLVGNFVIPVE